MCFYHRKCTLKKIMIYLSSIQVHGPVEFHPQTLGNKPSPFWESKLIGKHPRLRAEWAVTLRCCGVSKGLTLPVGQAEGQGPIQHVNGTELTVMPLVCPREVQKRHLLVHLRDPGSREAAQGPMGGSLGLNAAAAPLPRDP